MRIVIRYMAQVKLAAGRPTDELELAAPQSVREILVALAERHGEPLRRLLLTAAGDVQPTLLLFLGDEQVKFDQQAPRYTGEVLTILAPMAGGL